MIVYVESNFILELALRQKQAVSVEAIVQLAEHGKIELTVPSFALSEPFATITRRARDQDRLSKSIGGMLDRLPALLDEAAKGEQDNLWSIVSRLVTLGPAIETDVTCLTRAFEYQKRLRLSQQDSIIYAASIIDLQHRPLAETKCFLNSNHTDFKVPTIIAELNSYNCRYEQDFSKGLSFIRKNI